MRLLELAVKGVRGFNSPLTRVAFSPGVNAVVTADATVRQTVLDLIYFTLYPDTSRAGATADLAAPGAPESRVALSVEGEGGEVYRVVREVASGAASLYRKVAASEQFQVLTQTSAEVAQFLRVQENLPDEVGYERLYMLGPDTFPSRGAQVRCRSGHPFEGPSMPIAPVAPGLPGLRGLPDLPSGMAPLPSAAMPAEVSSMSPLFGDEGPPPLDLAPFEQPPVVQGTPAALELAPMESWSPVLTEEKRALYQQLEKMVGQVEAATAARAERDRLLAERAKDEDAIAELKRLDQRLAQLAAKPSMDLGEIPEDMADRMDSLEDAEERYELEVKRLSHEHLTADQAWSEFSYTPLQSDRYFIAGAGVAVAAIVLGLALDRPWIALLNIPAALVAVGAAFRYVGDLERRARLQHRLETVVDREQRMERQHQLETGVNKKLLEQLGLTRSEVRERLAARDRIDGQRRQLASKRAVLLEQVGGDAGVSAFAQLATALEMAEEKLALLDADNRSGDVSAMQARLRSLKAELDSHNVEPSRPGFEAPDERETVVEVDDDEEGYGSGYGTAGARRLPWEPSKQGLMASSGSFPLGGLGGLGGYGGGGGAQRPPDRSRELIAAAVDVLHAPLASLVEALPQRLSQYVAALTDGVYNAASLGPEGEVAVAPGVESQGIPYVALEPPLIDLVDSALRLTLVEACITRVPAPILIDDPFAHFDSRRRGMLRQMLGYLGAATQVIVLTPLDDLEGATQRL